MQPSRRAIRSKPSTSTRILDAAEAHFARHGYGAASLGDIADAVRIRTPSLYKHFASKRELYVAVVERLLSPYFELLNRLLRVPENAAHAERNLLAVAGHYMHTPNLARLVQHAALAGGEELDLLVERWYEPLFRRAAELTPAAGQLETARARQRVLSVVVTFHSMMAGYVTMAPLHARLTGSEPLEAPAIDDQLELMRRMAGELWKVASASGALDSSFGSLGRIRSRSADATETHEKNRRGRRRLASGRNSRGTLSRACMPDDLQKSLPAGKDKPRKPPNSRLGAPRSAAASRTAGSRKPRDHA